MPVMPELDHIVYYVRYALGIVAALSILGGIASFFWYGPRSYGRSLLDLDFSGWRIIGILALLGFLALSTWETHGAQ